MIPRRRANEEGLWSPPSLVRRRRYAGVREETIKPEFHEIEHRLVNFSSLGPVPRLKSVNDKIKNISSRKMFKKN